MIERIKQTVAQLLASLAKTGIGNITDYDPATYAVRVELQPSGVITGWMPIASHWVGNGFGCVAGPGIGDLVRVDFVDGNWQAALMGARYFNDGALPPAVPSGEFWLVHSTGSLLKLTNDGKVTVTDKAGSTVVLNGDGTGTASFAAGLTVNANTQLNGNLVVSGDVSDHNGTKGTLQHVRDTYDTHTHTDAQGGNTGTPSNTL